MSKNMLKKVIWCDNEQIDESVFNELTIRLEKAVFGNKKTHVDFRKNHVVY